MSINAQFALQQAVLLHGRNLSAAISDQSRKATIETADQFKKWLDKNASAVTESPAFDYDAIADELAKWPEPRFDLPVGEAITNHSIHQLSRALRVVGKENA